MEMANCPRCGKIFSKMSKPICDDCVREEEEIFQKLKKYIDDNPGNTLEQISEETGVSVKKIMKFMKDGRLEATKAMGKVLKCEQCGRPIVRGRFCDACVININQSVNELFDIGAERKGVVMHTRQSDKKDH